MRANASKTPAEQYTNEPAIAHLQKEIPAMMQQAQIPGLSIAIIRKGKTYWLQNYGARDANLKAPVTDETVFNVGSLSKPVFAYGVLKLVDEGKLSLDVPLTRYLPKPYIEGDDRLQRITARMVLSHRTGFPNWRGKDQPLKIYFTPGERFSYSGEGMVYLQRVVEQITKKPLNDFMQESVFGPLGMTSSSYVWRKDFEGHAATGYDSEGAAADFPRASEANSAASLETSARDYAVFVEAVLTGKGLKHATRRQMETAQIAVDPECTNCTDRVPRELSKNLFWGLGWGIQQTPQGESLWHWGDNGVFKAYVVARPGTKSGVVMLTNGENGLSIAREVVADVLGGDQPAFSWLKYDDYDSPSMQFAQAVRREGAAAALQKFSADLASGVISETAINRAGYSLLGRKLLADAILTFKKNVELYPASSNVYDSLGEAFMNNGQNDLAIRNYEKSLELDPANSNAVAMLKKLHGQ
ncbi:MAG TPA: serine hydrolase [Terriglobales bacterium]|nr:serine hydrolase [Terriglobales bacterium]